MRKAKNENSIKAAVSTIGRTLPEGCNFSEAVRPECVQIHTLDALKQHKTCRVRASKTYSFIYLIT